MYIDIVVKIRQFQRVQRKDIFTFFDLSHFNKKFNQKKILFNGLILSR